MEYTITPVYLGSAITQKADMIYRRHYGEELRICYVVYLVRGDNEVIMIDSGPPMPEVNKKLPLYLNLDDPVEIVTALSKVGTEPKDITKIIMTHLHWDHCYNLELFPQAEIYVQRRELSYAVCPSNQGEDMRMYQVLPACGGPPGWLPGFMRFKRLDGDVANLFPGISVYLTPGHSPGSQSILVDTKEGKYLMTGDLTPTFENFKEGIPNTVHTDLAEWFDSYNKIKDLPKFVLPGHEMGVFDRKIYG